MPWQRSSLRYAGELPDGDVPQWMSSEFEFWFRDARLIVQNMISNSDFKNDFDTKPVRIFDDSGSREYKNFMSGDWAWEEAVRPYGAGPSFISLTSTSG